MFFLLGGLAGAGVALLLTPQAGKITRQQIKEMSRDIRETFSSYYATAFEKIGNAADSGKGLMKQGKPLFMSAIEAGKEAYEKERQRVKREL
jgi:gas vesicle protein